MGADLRWSRSVIAWTIVSPLYFTSQMYPLHWYMLCWHCCSPFYPCTSHNSCTPLHATLICVSWKLLFLHSLGIKKLLDDRESKSCHQSNRSIQLNFRWQHSKTSLTAPTRHPYMLALLIRPKCAEPNKRGFYECFTFPQPYYPSKVFWGFCKNNFHWAFQSFIGDNFKVSSAGTWGLMGGRDIKRKLAGGDETSKDFHFSWMRRQEKYINKKKRKFLPLNASLHVLMM